MSKAQRGAQPETQAQEQVLEGSLLDKIVDEGRFGKDPAAKERGKELVKIFAAQVMEGSMAVSKDAEAMINARIARTPTSSVCNNRFRRVKSRAASKGR